MLYISQIKSLFTLLFTLFLAITCMAQEAKYLEFSLGLKHYQARDEYQSPLTYKGLAISPGLGYSQITNDWQSRKRFDVLSGGLSSSVAHKGSLDLNNFSYQSIRFSSIDEQLSVSYFVGLSIKANFGFRSKGNRGQWDVATSIAIVGAVNYRKKPTDRWSHEAILSIPIFAWAVRPRFTTPSYILSKKKWKGPSHFFMTIPKFMGFDFQLGSRYQMDNLNALRFSYESQYYQILPLHPVRVFNHGIVSSLLMRLN